MNESCGVQVMFFIIFFLNKVKNYGCIVIIFVIVYVSIEN